MIAHLPPPAQRLACLQSDSEHSWVAGPRVLWTRAALPERARTALRAGSQAAPPPKGSPETARPFRVLVIEDDETLRALVRRILLLEGYSVLEAADGELGLRLIETHPGGLDLVLTAIEIPNIDGITVAEVLGALRPLLGVICMSGDVGQSEFGERLGLRRQPFLAKPFMRDDLLLTTADTLARSQELLARQSVTRGLSVLGDVEAPVDLVAAAHRLRAARARPGPSQSAPVRRAMPEGIAPVPRSARARVRGSTLWMRSRSGKSRSAGATCAVHARAPRFAA
jgi:CheY-like chemotaxis protein